MKSLRQTVCVLIFMAVIALFVSCQSVADVSNPHRWIYCSAIKSEGYINSGDKKNNRDVFIRAGLSTASPYELFGVPTEKVRLRFKVYYQDKEYPLKITFHLVRRDSNSHDYYRDINIKKLPRNYDVSELESTGFKWFRNISDFSMDVTKDMLPVVITSFKIDGKIFYVLASKYFNDTINYMPSLLDLILLEEQWFVIVDENGNEYASFSKSDFRICNQPDSEKYDFIPLIAAYSYFFSIMK